MARKRYPSDEARVKMRPHAKVHLSVATHPKTAAIWADVRKRGMLVELWRLAEEAYAGRNGDQLVLTAGPLRSLTGATREPRAIHAATSLFTEMGYPWRSDGKTVTVTIRNFDRKQHGDSADCGVAPRTPSAPSASASASASASEEEKNQSASRGSSAALFPSASEPPKAKTAKPPKPKPPKSAEPKPSSRAIAIFCEEFKAALGTQAVVPSKDFRELGELLKQLGEKHFRNAATVYFDYGQRKDEWIRKQGYSAREFIRQITKMHSFAQERAKWGGPMKSKSVAEQEAEWMRNNPLTAEQMADVFECSLDEAQSMLAQSALAS